MSCYVHQLAVKCVCCVIAGQKENRAILELRYENNTDEISENTLWKQNNELDKKEAPLNEGEGVQCGDNFLWRC